MRVAGGLNGPGSIHGSRALDAQVADHRTPDRRQIAYRARISHGHVALFDVGYFPLAMLQSEGPVSFDFLETLAALNDYLRRALLR